MCQLGANLGPTWGALGPIWAKMGPTWDQLGAHLGQTLGNLGQLGPTWEQLGPAWAKMKQRRPTWGQLEARTDVKIIEKPLFFLGFSNNLKKSFKSFGNVFGDPLGTPWGAFGDAWAGLGAALGSLGGALGGLGNALGDLSWKTCLGRPWESLERAPRSHVNAKLAKHLSPISL